MMTLTNESQVKKVKQKAPSTGGVIGYPKTELFFSTEIKTRSFLDQYIFITIGPNATFWDLINILTFPLVLHYIVMKIKNMFLQETELRD